MKSIKSIVIFLTLILFGSSAYAGDPRCTPDGYISSAIVGAVAGLLVGDNHRSAGRGAGAMVGVQAITCATQSYRRVTTYGGGYQQGPVSPYPPGGGNYGGYDQGGNNDYYDAGRYTYRPRVYHPLPYREPPSHQQQARPYYDGNGVHYNPYLGLCKFAPEQGPTGYHSCP